MALVDHVTDRFGTNTSFLRNLTNHDDRTATTVNATRLAEAAASAEGQFPRHAGIAYDDTIEAHIDAGVLGVIAYLRMWSSKQGSAEPEMEKFRSAMHEISQIGARKRITPVGKVAADREDDKDLFAGVSPDAPELT